ncbi:hypothetical protein [Paenibacillus sp. SI8]|uniref:hypothetical protein n=1 Tax=unclassified Paenibacillus TaxID=185978 RepID=UPI0034671BB0
MSKIKNDSPKVAKDNSLTLEIKSKAFSFKSFPDNPLNEKIAEAVNGMGRVGADADHKYQKTLAGLSRSAKEVTALISAEYHQLQEDEYLNRWSLVQLLNDLKQPSTLTALEDIVAKAIPPERSDDPHSFSTVGEEVIIRTTAIEAITRIAASGDEHAKALLLRHTAHDNFSVKRASIQGYLTYGGKDAHEVLLKTLPEEDHYILDIKRTDVRKVPQAEGGLHVVNRDKDVLPPPV